MSTPPFEVVGAATYDGDTDTLSPVVTLDARVKVSVFEREFEGIVNNIRNSGGVEVADIFVPALNNTVIENVDALTVIEPTPLPDLNPVEALAEIIAKATTGLHALATEHEGNLRTTVLEIRDLSAALADLVERW